MEYHVQLFQKWRSVQEIDVFSFCTVSNVLEKMHNWTANLLIDTYISKLAYTRSNDEFTIHGQEIYDED